MALPWYDVHGGAGTGEGGGAGSGVTVVLLHAFPLSSVVFDRLLPPLVAGGVRVARVDLPGLGRSVSAATGEPSVGAMADAVVAVLDGLGVDDAVVHGVSTGGYVALELVARHPGRVAALALGSTTSRVIAPDEPADRRRLADDLDATGDLAELVDGADAGLGETAQRDQPDLLPLLRGVVADSDPAGVAWVARALADRRDTTYDLAAWDGPVLLLFGDEDTETPPVRAEELAAARVDSPGETRTVVLPVTGHLTALERPDEVAAELLRLAKG